MSSAVPDTSRAFESAPGDLAGASCERLSHKASTQPLSHQESGRNRWITNVFLKSSAPGLQGCWKSLRISRRDIQYFLFK